MTHEPESPPRVSCTNHSPPWFVGHWREWHRGHGCSQDDGKPRSEAAATEIAQHSANGDTGRLTDAELGFLRAATTSGDTLLVRALTELTALRSGNAAAEALTATELNSLRGSASSSGNTLLKRAISELTSRRSTSPGGSA